MVSFFTDRCLDMAPSIDCHVKVAWLIEPTTACPGQFNRILAARDHFDWVLTWNRDLIALGGSRFRFYPFGGCWIPPAKRGLHAKPKDKGVSLLASSKDGCFGYMLRHAAVAQFTDRIDCFGAIVGQPLECKAEAIADFMFSVVIENARMNDWFTEKIIDCFACGTIPIYWGTPNIGHYFDPDGIIYFGNGESLQEDLAALNACLRTATRKLYESRQGAVAMNCLKVNEFQCAEDWIFEHYPDLLI